MVCNISSCILLYYYDNNVIFFYIIILERKVILILIIVAFSGCIITDFEGRVSLADSGLPSGSRFHRIPSGYKLNNNNDITGLRKLS